MSWRRYLVGWGFMFAFAALAQDHSEPPILPSPPALPAPPAMAGPPAMPAALPLAPLPVQAAPDKRVFGVFPNYRTVEAGMPFHPITSRQKMAIAARDSFDWPVFPTSAAFAAMYQFEGQNPSFGQGMAGYGKRLGGAYGDQMIGNFMTEGIVPSLFHQDPRYFRLGVGTTRSRLWYAATRIFVAPMDSGRNTFNFSEWGGNALAVAISNAYYPDTRNWNDNLQRLLIQCGSDALSNVMKEFWPNVKRRLWHKPTGTQRGQPGQLPSSPSP